MSPEYATSFLRFPISALNPAATVVLSNFFVISERKMCWVPSVLTSAAIDFSEGAVKSYELSLSVPPYMSP